MEDAWRQAQTLYPFTSINPSVSWWKGAVSTKNRMHFKLLANKKLTLTPGVESEV